MKETYTQAEVRELLYKLLDENTPLVNIEINKRIDRYMAPTMKNLTLNEYPRGVFTVRGQDENDLTWDIIQISSKGVKFFANISESTGWNLDCNGELNEVEENDDF